MLLEIIFFLAVMLSVIIHEVAHGFVARVYGDQTAYMAGRLTINPLRHIDLLGTIIIPLLLFFSNASFIFGWAKPVPINPRNFSDYKRGLFWTSFAGPLANLTIAAFLSSFLKSANLFLYPAMIRQIIVVNLVLAFFNLIPIPPLDGSKMLDCFLPANLSVKYQRIDRYGIIIILVLLQFNLLDYFFNFLTPVFRLFL